MRLAPCEPSNAHPRSLGKHPRLSENEFEMICESGIGWEWSQAKVCSRPRRKGRVFVLRGKDAVHQGVHLHIYTPAFTRLHGRPSPVPSGRRVGLWGRPVARSPEFRLRKTVGERQLCHFLPGRPGESPLTLEPHFLVCEMGVRPAALS